MTAQSLPIESAVEPRLHARDGGRVIATNALVEYLGSIGLTGLRFLTKLVLIRSITAADFGRVVTTQNLLAMVLLFASVGIDEAVVRFVGLHAGDATGRARSIVDAAVRFAVGLGTAAAVVLLLTSDSLSGWLGLGSSGDLGIMLATLVIVPTLVSDILGGSFQGLNRMWVKVVVLDLSRALATLGGYTLIAALGWATYVGVMSIQAAAALLSCGLMMAALRRTPDLTPGHGTIAFSELLNYSVPLFVSALIGGAIVGNGIPLVLAAEHGAEVVAVYAVALTTPLLLQMPATALENAAIPVWSAAAGRETTRQLTQSFAEVTRWALLLALLILVPLATAASECLTLLFGSSYAETTGLVHTALAATLFSVGVGPTEGMLRAFGATRALSMARLLAGGVAVAVAWPFVKHWGAAGAVAAWAVNEFMANGVCSYYLYRSHGIHPVDRRYARTLATGAAAWVLCATVAPAVDGMGRIAVVVATSALTIGTIGLVVGAWSTEELRRLIRPARHDQASSSIAPQS